MRCSKCGYVGFAHLESCLGCGALLNLPATGGTPLYLGQSALDISPGPDLKIPVVYGEPLGGMEEEPRSLKEAPPEEGELEAAEKLEAGEPLKEAEEEPLSLKGATPGEKKPEARAPEQAAPSLEQKEEEEALSPDEDLQALWAQPVDEEEGEEAAPKRQEPPAETQVPPPLAAERREDIIEDEKAQGPEPLSAEGGIQEAGVNLLQEEMATEEKRLLWEGEAYAPSEPAQPGVDEAWSLPGGRVGLGRRVLAGAIDLTLLLLITFLFAAGTFVILNVDLMSLGENPRAMLVLSSLNLGFLFLLSLLYTLFFLGGGGQTIGAMVLGFEVVRGDGAPLGYKRALLRYLGFLLSCLPLFLGLLMALADRQGRALHDRLSGSISVIAR